MRHKELEKAVLAVMLGKQVDETVKHPNQQKLDVHEPEKDELTAKDFEMLRSGKKAKMKEEVEEIDELSKEKMSSYLQKRGSMVSPRSKNNKGNENMVRAVNKIAKKTNEEVEINDDADETILVHTPIEFELAENYMFGDYLTAAKSIVGEEAAIELANYAFNNNDTDIFVEQFLRSDIEAKVKAHEKMGHKVSTPKYSTKSGKPHAEYVVTDKEGVRRKYIHHGANRKTENMGPVGKRDDE